MSDNYGVVIVAYYPGDNLIKLIQTLFYYDNKVNIVVVDNTGSKNKVITEIENNFESCRVIINEQNMGIADALNKGIERFYKEGVKWVLTFDQDSLITGNIVKSYFDFINDKYNDLDRIGMIATNYIDLNTGKLCYPDLSKYTEVNEAISSGSFINTNIFMELGRYKEYYFMDQVDNEYCYRLAKNAKKIFLLPENMMEHTLGNISSAKFFGKNFYLYNQNPIRYYYRTRNSLFIIHEYKNIKITRDKIKQLALDLLRIFFENNRATKIKHYMHGVIDGILYKKNN